VITGAFVFVFWFSGAGKGAEQKIFQVRFTGSVSGLTVGGSVLFNGLKVGEVTQLGLMNEDPSQVEAHITVDARTPVKTDTKAQLESGALTNVASVALEGGSIDAPPLPPNGIINAAPSNLKDLLTTVQKMSVKADVFLEHANKLLDENAPALSTSITNIQTLTGALADSSGNIKDIMASVDPAKVRAIVDNANQAVDKLNNILGTGQGKELVNNVADAARSIKKLADNLDVRSKDLIANLTRFSNTGLKQYESLAVDGRRTLDNLDQAVRQIQRNPQSVIFGAKPALPEYNGR
jgi:phospholipid/cholesterol/gamma-HCH transport system substrate-binding protein